VAQHLELWSFGRDLRGLSAILHFSRMSLSSPRLLGTLRLSRISPLLPIGRPTSCPTRVSNIFIMMNTSCIELLTSVSFPSKFSNIFSIASNLVMVSLSILDMAVLTLLACGSCFDSLWLVSFFLYLHLLHPPLK
jgi:hypothetical protein